MGRSHPPLWRTTLPGGLKSTLHFILKDWVDQIRTDIVHYQKMVFFQLNYNSFVNLCRKLELNQYLNLTRNPFYLLNYIGFKGVMPRERIELPYLRLQCNALAAKPPRLLYQAPEGTLWRKIESNYHICSASTTDYHYQISP